MDTQERTGWGKAEIQLSGELDYDPNSEITECDAPSNSRESGLDLDEDKIREAKAESRRVAEMCGWR